MKCAWFSIASECNMFTVQHTTRTVESRYFRAHNLRCEENCAVSVDIASSYKLSLNYIA